MKHVVLAVAIAPGVGVLAGTLASIPFLAAISGGLVYTVLMAIVGSIIAYSLGILAGVPVYLALRWINAQILWVYVLLGALFGLVGWSVAASPTGPSLEWRAAQELVFALVAGVVGAVVFWRIATQVRGAGVASDEP